MIVEDAESESPKLPSRRSVENRNMRETKEESKRITKLQRKKERQGKARQGKISKN